METYIETHGGLDYPTDVSIDDLDTFLNIGVLTDVAAYHLNSGPRVLQVFNKFSGGCFIHARSAKEDKLPGTLLCHPFGYAATQTSETANHEICLLRREGAIIFGWQDLSLPLATSMQGSSMFADLDQRFIIFER